MPYRAKPEHAAQRSACLHLRFTLDLRADEIARRVGISEARAYHYLRGHPRKAKTRTARHFWWSDTEVETLRRVYPKGSRSDICRSLPGRGWLTIERKACELEVRREPDNRRKILREVHSIIRRLRLLRISRKMTAAALAKKAGIPRQSITHWELGLMRPNLDQLVAWAAAFGLDVALVGAAAVDVEARPVPPARAASVFDMKPRPAPSNQVPWRRLDLIS